MKKESLGALIILVGISLFGFVWFKKNKPKTSDEQLIDLTNQSNALKTGSTENIDKPFEYTEEQKKSAGKNPFTVSTVKVENLTPKEVKDIMDSIGVIYDPNSITNQIALNMQNGNLDFSQFDFSNIKIK